MTEGFGWLPASVVRAQHFEDVAEAREARAGERDRADRAEQMHDRAVAAYLAAAATRGEHVTPMDAVAGNVGRDLADVLRDAASRMDATLDQADERFYGEPVIQGAQRSSWPGSAYEADSQIARAQQAHRDLVSYKARCNYPDAEDAARAKSERQAVIYR